MKKRYLGAICAVVIVACGLSLAQPPKQPVLPNNAPVPPSDSPRFIPADQLPPGTRVLTPSPSPAPIQAETKPEEMTIEQLIEAMEKTRAEIVEREKKNQARLTVLQDKVAKLKARMDTFTGNRLQIEGKEGNRDRPLPEPTRPLKGF